MYTPPQKTLEKYADVLVNFALGDDEGIDPGDTVNVVVNEYAKPLLEEIQQAILDSGGHMVLTYLPDEFSRRDYVNRAFYECASEAQLEHFPKNYFAGLYEDVDHMMFIIAETDKQALEGIDSERIMKRNETMWQFHGERLKRDARGELTWVIAMYATEAMASEVDLTEEEYWEEITKACYLDKDDPIAAWRDTYEQIDTFKERLNDLDIASVHIEAENIDLTVQIGEKRRWKGGSGRNIPSYEIFTSPDWRGTEGTISFNQPLYRYGNLITDISLTFEKGKVVEASASQNEQILKDMIATENANKIGEFSLTDSRHSRITRFLGETLFDENMGGEFGNTHIALGSAYKDCVNVDQKETTDEEWEELGVNDSSVHTDIISTEDRTVTATLEDGSQKVIYKNGKFQL